MEAWYILAKVCDYQKWGKRNVWKAYTESSVKHGTFKNGGPCSICLRRAVYAHCEDASGDSLAKWIPASPPRLPRMEAAAGWANGFLTGSKVPRCRSDWTAARVLFKRHCMVTPWLPRTDCGSCCLVIRGNWRLRQPRDVRTQLVWGSHSPGLWEVPSMWETSVVSYWIL
jgi:hypothetical protein